MTVVNRVLVETLHLVERQFDIRNLGGTQTPTPNPAAQTTSSAPAQSSTTMATSGGGGGGTSSPLLFFVALGFGVVFTNLWIIVGVKYCFRYNARNRAIRNGEEVDPINLENMPTRPHRRRREKKLMTMDEVNERFPLTKYKTWVATRAHEGLPTAGGVTASPSRAASLRDVDAPSSPVGTKHSVGTRPATANSEVVTSLPSTNNDYDTRKSFDDKVIDVEKGVVPPVVENQNALEHVRTTSSTVDKHPTITSELDDDDDDDHIHTAVPPELLTNPGDSCAICIDTLEEDDDIRGLTCGHAFHAGCLDPWLTSRRACCPLCKADYYVPKPRPEGEAAETDRSGRRSRLPQPPASAWTGIRAGPRLILPGRFVGYGDGHDYGQPNPRRARRARRDAAAAAAQNASTTGDAGAAENANLAAPNRWRPRNPFSSLHMPRMPGRARQNDPTPTVGTDPSPSQLEAGTVVR